MVESRLTEVLPCGSIEVLNERGDHMSDSNVVPITKKTEPVEIVDEDAADQAFAIENDL